MNHIPPVSAPLYAFPFAGERIAVSLRESLIEG